MSRIYLDITDLVEYVTAFGRLTGIQRVQDRILSELAELPDAGRVWCVSICRGGAAYRACLLRDLYAVKHSGLRERFSVLADPGSSRLRSFVREARICFTQYGIKGFKRAFLKFCFLARGALPWTGSRSQLVNFRSMTVVELQRLPIDSILVLMGACWNVMDVAVAAAEHRKSGSRVVKVVYDLIPIKRPQYFTRETALSFRNYFSFILPHVSKYVCISSFTQLDLQALLAESGISAPSVVLPLAHEFSGYPRNARGCLPRNVSLMRFRSPALPFFLCVGTLEVRKNGITLLKVWQRLKSLLPGEAPHLVFVGSHGWKIDPFFELLASDPWLRSHVSLIRDASDADIAFLHECSLCSIYPSLYEGWGLPVGEAAWFGRTCITSQESALPEVCGTLVDYVEPLNIDQIASRVEQVISNSEWVALRESLIRQASLRTWHDVAENFWDVLSD